VFELNIWVGKGKLGGGLALRAGDGVIDVDRALVAPGMVIMSSEDEEFGMKRRYVG
jgi:tRNA A37 N6-isopentenylltransferase MiaA